MKRTTLKLGSFLLALCLLVALLPGAAFAGDLDNADVYESYTLSGVKGDYYQWYWSSTDGEDIFDFDAQSEYWPDGLAIHKSSNDSFVVEGTPNEAGSFWVTATCSTADHDFTIDLSINIESGGGYDKPEMYASDSLTGKVGTAVSDWSWGTIDGEWIGNLYIDQGSLPAGLYIPTPGSNCFQICGTPTTAGKSSCTVTVETADDIYYVEISFNIKSNNFEITKSPTSEYTSDGGSATFIAGANNYSYVEWLLISNGSTVATYTCNTNTYYGNCNVITYNDSGKEYLVLKNIPANMNGFRVQARFTNSSMGTAILTDSCTLSVDPPPLTAPVISRAPSAVTADVGKDVTLSVSASDPNGGALQYQWYSNTQADFRGATSIAGANQSSYTPPQTVGTIYYYCSIVSVKDGYSSSASKTTPVAVTYNAASAVTPSPNPSADPSASPAVSPEVSPTATPAAVNGKTSGSSPVLPILLGVLIVLVAALLVCQLIYMGKKNKGEAVPLVKWDCPECGTRNKAGSRFCSECGAKNPRLKK